ncbi:MAG: hypothetical protein LBT86_06285 [Deltaproteobacteria bacterium]|jgi:hypothetical protein|nr:hypothetical protein [Deltaproteobacteria bacterium]
MTAPHQAFHFLDGHLSLLNHSRYHQNRVIFARLTVSPRDWGIYEVIFRGDLAQSFRRSNFQIGDPIGVVVTNLTAYQSPALNDPRPKAFRGLANLFLDRRTNDDWALNASGSTSKTDCAELRGLYHVKQPRLGINRPIPRAIDWNKSNHASPSDPSEPEPRQPNPREPFRYNPALMDNQWLSDLTKKAQAYGQGQALAIFSQAETSVPATIISLPTPSTLAKARNSSLAKASNVYSKLTGDLASELPSELASERPSELTTELTTEIDPELTTEIAALTTPLLRLVYAPILDQTPPMVPALAQAPLDPTLTPTALAPETGSGQNPHSATNSILASASISSSASVSSSASAQASSDGTDQEPTQTLPVNLNFATDSEPNAKTRAKSNAKSAKTRKSSLKTTTKARSKRTKVSSPRSAKKRALATTEPPLFQELSAYITDDPAASLTVSQDSSSRYLTESQADSISGSFSKPLSEPPSKFLSDSQPKPHSDSGSESISTTHQVSMPESSLNPESELKASQEPDQLAQLSQPGLSTPDQLGQPVDQPVKPDSFSRPLSEPPSQSLSESQPKPYLDSKTESISTTHPASKPESSLNPESGLKASHEPDQLAQPAQLSQLVGLSQLGLSQLGQLDQLVNQPVSQPVQSDSFSKSLSEPLSRPPSRPLSEPTSSSPSDSPPKPHLDSESESISSSHPVFNQESSLNPESEPRTPVGPMSQSGQMDQPNQPGQVLPPNDQAFLFKLFAKGTKNKAKTKK